MQSFFKNAITAALSVLRSLIETERTLGLVFGLVLDSVIFGGGIRDAIGGNTCEQTATYKYPPGTAVRQLVR